MDRATFEKAVKRWQSDWRPVRATFLLEFAAAAAGRVPLIAQAQDTTTLSHYDILRSSLEFVTRRAYGSDSRGDQYELLWHKTMLGVLQGHGMLGTFLQEQCLAALEARFNSRVTGRVGVALEPRFLLAAAIARAQRCCTRPELARAQAAPSPPTPAKVSPAALQRGSTWQSRLDEAVALFDRAARHPSVESEARLRGALLLWERGRSSEALSWLESSSDDQKDPELIYWRRILRGRLLDALSRPADATVAYGAALDLFPRSQTAAIGLAVAMMRDGRYSEASDLARTTRTGPIDMNDPWWEFETADRRFVTAWVGELRRSNQ